MATRKSSVKLLSIQKSRLTNVLNKIINSETLSEAEIKQLDEQIKKQKQLSNDSGYIICQHCGTRLNIKNIERHKLKCRGQKQKAKKKLTAPKKGKTEKNQVDLEHI